MSIFTFVKSKGFIINLGIAIVFVGAILYGTFFGLEIYTQHGISYTVPDFSGMTVEEVDTLCGDRNFEFEIIDSVHINSVARGAVVEQMPEGGAKVKDNRTIYITINALLPEMIKMPNLHQTSYREARARLETYGIGIDSLDYRPGFENLVLDQMYNGKSIKEGTLIEKGAKIVLVVGEGVSNKSRLVPRLLGYTVEEARSKMLDIYLNLVVVYDDNIETAEDSATAKIYKQSPISDGKNEVNLGGSVDVYVTTNKGIIPAMVNDTLANDTTNNEK